MKQQRFAASIRKVGINPCVDVPTRVSAALARSGYIPVRGTLNGHAFRSGLVSLAGGRHRLFINGQMRRKARVDTGDRIMVVLDHDTKPRKVPVPMQLTTALKSNPRANQVWKNLVPSKRKEILSYLNWLKRPETLARNIERTIEYLLSR